MLQIKEYRYTVTGSTTSSSAEMAQTNLKSAVNNFNLTYPGAGVVSVTNNTFTDSESGYIKQFVNIFYNLKD